MTSFESRAQWYRSGPVLVASLLCLVALPSHGFSTLIPSNTNCSGCHGDPLVGSTPTTGTTLVFGVNGKTLVGGNSSASFTIDNASTSQRGGFKGSFPTATGAFSTDNNSLTIIGDQGFLRAQKSPMPLPQNFVSESQTYVFTPTTRGADSQSITFTPLSTQFTSVAAAAAQARTVTLQGQGVAPLASLDVSLADAGRVLVGTNGASKLTLHNIGDGNQSGAGSVSNLNGSFASGSGAFSGTGSAFSLPDAASQMQIYAFNPTTRGLVTAGADVSASNGSSNGQNMAQLLAAQLSGFGVAPVASVDTSQAHAGPVRIGTSGVATLSLQNVGDGNLSGLSGAVSNLNGNFADGSGSFSGAGATFSLADNASLVQQYSFTPLTAGSASLTVDVDVSNGSRDGSNLAETIQAELSGLGVSPVFAASTGPTIDFGTVSGSSLMPLMLMNDAPGADLGDLTALSLLSFQITGPDAGLFSLLHFGSGARLAIGDSLALEIVFDGTGLDGPRSAILSFATDEGSGLGLAGNAHNFSLMAAAVPEPTTAMMLLAGLACMGSLAARRRSA